MTSKYKAPDGVNKSRATEDDVEGHVYKKAAPTASTRARPPRTTSKATAQAEGARRRQQEQGHRGRRRGPRLKRRRPDGVDKSRATEDDVEGHGAKQKAPDGVAQAQGNR